jgi:ubiquinone/menaquinone biosynthesis C-methylase UbiE
LLPYHIKLHLLNKWWLQVQNCFCKNSQIIDIECGDGTTLAFLQAKSVHPIGVDLSKKLIDMGTKQYPELHGKVMLGNALNLQFKDDSFDVALLISVLHHIHSHQQQTAVVRETLRVVRKYGFVIIRESNLLNPLFRVFWNYVFPFLAKIDRFGGESWISLDQLLETYRDVVYHASYFTFIPSFTPNFLLSYAERLEKVLEKSFLKKFSAHYVLILQKP